MEFFSGKTKGSFKFHPVGQGLFYSGVIENDRNCFTFVYDCGGTNKDTIDNAVDCFLDSIRDRKIDLLVLSHLHEDHINGIEKILGRLKPDGKIVMPYLDRDLELLYLYQSSVKKSNNSFLNSFYTDPIGIIRGDERKDVEIIFISHSIEDGIDKEHNSFKDSSWKNNYSSRNVSLFLKDGGVKTSILLTDCFEFLLSQFNWRFRITQPFVDSSILIKYKNYVNKYNSVTDLLRDKSAIKHLKRINNFQNKSCLLMEHVFCYPKRCLSTVLTGDLPETQIRKVKDKLLNSEKLFVYQIPHHGAKASASVTDSCFSVVSYGVGNTYGHPFPDTISQYLANSNIILVNENDFFEY